MLKGKNAIITGARQGIGRAILEEFAQNGANIWACARKQDIEFEEKIGELSELYHIWIKPIYFDLSDQDSIKDAMKRILQEKIPIDILVNNAGISYSGLMTMTPIAKLREVFEINYFAQIQIMQVVAKSMIRQKKGSIVNIVSVGGIETAPGYLAYGSSKAALLYATKSVSHELGEHGIRLNAVAPGLTNTKMGHAKEDKELQKVLNRSSLHRMAEPKEIASCVAFLASDKASFITGQVIIADGGRICS